MRSSPWKRWWERAVSSISTLTAKVRATRRADFQHLKMQTEWIFKVKSFKSHVKQVPGIDGVLEQKCFVDICRVGDFSHFWLKQSFFLQVGQRMWKSRMCTSVTTAWTSRLTCSTRSIATATQCAPNSTPSTTSPRGSPPRGTSRWECCQVLSGWGCWDPFLDLESRQMFWEGGGEVTAPGAFRLSTAAYGPVPG